MKAHVEFYFVFVCPLCFLATKPLREIIRDKKLRLNGSLSNFALSQLSRWSK